MITPLLIGHPDHPPPPQAGGISYQGGARRGVWGWGIQTDSTYTLFVLGVPAGVPAGRVSNGEDLYNDEQLRYRQHLVTVDHPHMGRHSVEAPGFRLSETPAFVDRPGPDLGEHNELVFCQWLGVSDSDFVELMAQGAFD